MRYDAWCSYVPYLDHLAPIWRALPEVLRGDVYVTAAVFQHARDLGLDPVPQEAYVPREHPFIVFSRSEFTKLPDGPVVFIEHGVGPAYDGRSHLIPRNSATIPPILGLLTTPANAPAHRALLGDDYVHEIGCPKLDVWHGLTFDRPRRRRPVVAFSHHWNERAHPEARSAWPWDKDAWERIAASCAYELLGHKHPGDTRDIAGWCAEMGVEFTASFDDVLTLADVYVADNTSTLYEFAATGRPVVCLSPPFYRRTIDHGLRFWNHLPGVECALTDHLEACIDEALVDVPSRAALRRAAVEAAYGPLDGQATARAVDTLACIAAAPPTPRTVTTEQPHEKPPLRYPVPLGKDVEWQGQTLPKGTPIDRDTAVAMKAAGLLTDPRIV